MFADKCDIYCVLLCYTIIVFVVVAIVCIIVVDYCVIVLIRFIKKRFHKLPFHLQIDVCYYNFGKLADLLLLGT